MCLCVRVSVCASMLEIVGGGVAGLVEKTVKPGWVWLEV